jgi:Methyltransferase domain
MAARAMIAGPAGPDFGNGGCAQSNMSDAANVSSYLPRIAATDSFSRLTGKPSRPPAALDFSLEHIRRHNLQSVLHLECGDGAYTGLLAEAGVKKIVGISSDAALIATAKKNNSGAAQANGALEFLCGTLDDIEGDNQFDLVLALHLFQAIRNPLSSLARARAVAAHSVVGMFAKDSWYAAAKRGSSVLFRRRPIYCYKSNGLEMLGNMAGFARTEIEELGFWGPQYLVTFHKTHHRNSRRGSG